MIHLILHYLLALPDTPISPSTSRGSVSAARKRKSMDLATMMASSVEISSTPALYNLVDLIQGSLKSQSQQTISVTLQLVSVILRSHHRYAVTTLLWTSQILHNEPERTIGAYERQMEFLLTLAEDVGSDIHLDEVYETHIRDSMSVLESHHCSIDLIAPKSAAGTTRLPGAQPTIPGGPRDIRPHTLRLEDPLLKTLLEILGTFFTNAVETNLSLTGVIIDLATCGFMRIDGWLLPDPSKYVYNDVDEDSLEDRYLDSIGDPIETSEDAQVRALKKARRPPQWVESQLPPILQQFRVLVDQVSLYRSEIPRFDEILHQRRDAFQAASSATEAPMTIRQPPRSSFDSSSRDGSPPKTTFDSLAQRIFPELASPSRSHSPRGRRSQDQQRSSVAGGYGSTAPTSSRGAVPGPQFPQGLESPSRGTSRAFSPSPLRDTQSATQGQGVLTSQLAAFAAVDQSILARKVGQPSAKGQICSVPLPNLRETGSVAVIPTVDGTIESKVAISEDRAEEGSLSEEMDKEEADAVQKLVTVSHVLTNVIVLQEFLLELAALVQVRAGLFSEVRFV